MKVLLINAEHALLGGAHTVYFSMSDMLTNAGHKVIFFAMHCSNELPCAQSPYFAKTNSRKNVLRYVKNSFYNSNAANCLQKLIDDEHPDIAHVHLMWGSLSPSILVVLKENNIPIIHTVHDYAMICSRVTLKSKDGAVCEKCSGGHYCQSIKTRCYNGSLLKSIVATTEFSQRNKRHHPVSLIDHFNFVSQFCCDKHKEMDGRFKCAQTSVIYNVPSEDVVNLSKGGLRDTYESYYLYYGRLSYEKGLDTLITSFLDKPHLKLKIIGTGPLEERLKARCDGHADNIEFLGFKKGVELYELVKNAKFVCVPSEWYENCPMTIIEGFTLAVPVIGARIGGIPELVAEGENGFLFDSGSLDSLNEAITKSESLLEADYMRMKNNALNISRSRFNRDKYVDNLLEVYQKTIKEYKK